jgi:small subunit ribosomal protein S9
MKAARLPVSFVRSAQCCCSARPRTSQYLPRQRSLQRPSSKSFSTSPQVASIAAPEIDFDGDNKFEKLPQINARLVPESPSYFTGSPQFIDNLLSLQALLRKHETLPILPPAEAPRVAWRTLIDYRNLVGESVKAAKYQKIIRVLQRLNQIHPSLMPNDVKVALSHYKRDINPQLNSPRPILIDKFGRALAAGRRKSSVARAWVVEGNGEVLINGKTLTEAFGRVHDRESAIWALKATERVDKYNVWALVDGGGTTGQAEALTLAIAKALLAHEPLLKPALRRGKLYYSIYRIPLFLKQEAFHFCESRPLIYLFICTEGEHVTNSISNIAGCITRDPRRVERKKPGHIKARKKPTWVKR